LFFLGSVGLFAVASPPQKPDPHHPATLVGEWVDLRHTSATDSMVWVLGPNGDDATLEIRIEPGAGRTEHRHHYGRWRLDGDLTDPVHRALCFTHRPGRQGASCIAFRLDTLTDAAGSRGHLVLQNYRGAHHVLDRELVERTR
jgi:hypothetical protein